jgi:hypothetical protein
VQDVVLVLAGIRNLEDDLISGDCDIQDVVLILAGSRISMKTIFQVCTNMQDVVFLLACTQHLEYDHILGIVSNICGCSFTSGWHP